MPKDTIKLLVGVVRAQGHEFNNKQIMTQRQLLLIYLKHYVYRVNTRICIKTSSWSVFKKATNGGIECKTYKWDVWSKN